MRIVNLEPMLVQPIPLNTFTILTVSIIFVENAALLSDIVDLVRAVANMRDKVELVLSHCEQLVEW